MASRSMIRCDPLLRALVNDSHTTRQAARQESVSESVVKVFGPASLSNLGPGFDTLGLCLNGLGDHVEACLADAPGVQLDLASGPEGGATPSDPARNTAGRAAQVVLEQSGESLGVILRLHKGISPGSGIGSSAASAVAGAWATNEVLGRPFTKEELVEAVLEGESIASGCRHGDNVLPALFGGLVLVSPSDPADYRRMALPGPLPIAVIQPAIEVLTVRARALLPPQVPLRDAVRNAADLAFMLDAFRAGDWAAVGRHMMRDRLVEPVRAGLVPCYEAVRGSALEAGAFGCALTGSGPAMFALCESRTQAAGVVEVMCEASRTGGIEARGWVTEADPVGVRTV